MAESDFDRAVTFARNSRREIEQREREQGLDARGVRAAADLLIGQPAAYLETWITGAIPASRESNYEWGILNNLAERMRPAVPPALAEWVANRPPRPRKGPRHDRRDYAIARTIFWIVDSKLALGFRKNTAGPRAGDGRSACDAAGIAWGMNYSAVEKIWLEQRHKFDGLTFEDDA